MKNKGIILLMGLVLTISFLFSGCSKETNETPKEANEVNSVESNDVNTAADDTAAEAAAATVDNTAADGETATVADEPSADNEPAADAAPVADEPASEDKEEAADEDDFSVYLDVDYKPYFKKATKAGRVDQITYYSEVFGADRTALVYKPDGYPRDAKYPVIVLIHGLGCDENQWTSMSACDAIDHMIEDGIIKPCVAVFPSVVPAGGLTKDSYSAENIGAFTDFIDEWQKDLWPYLYAHYPLLENREAHAVCGLSMGGMEALRLGFTYLDFFDFIGSFSAAPSLDTSILTAEGSEYKPDLVLICTGDRDNTVGENPHNYYKTIVDNGIDSIWYLHPGEGHSPAVWNLGLYNFLLRLDGSFKPE